MCFVDGGESQCADLQGDVYEGMKAIICSTTSAGCELVRRLQSAVCGRMNAGNATILSVGCFLTWSAEVSVSGIDTMALFIRDTDWCMSKQRSISKWTKEVYHVICMEATPRPLVLYIMSSSSWYTGNDHFACLEITPTLVLNTCVACTSCMYEEM